MDGDPSKIPVEPIAFDYELTRFAQGITLGKPMIVAIGSSTTAGEGNIPPYPERLLSLLKVPYPNPKFTMVNAGIGGQEAPVELLRFDADVIAHRPDLVIWQVGTNAVWQQDQGLKPPPPSFDETIAAIRAGLIRLRDATAADVILMDLQYVPALLTPAKKGKAIEMVHQISELAREAKVNVFRRFAFMKGLYEIEGVSFDRMVDPADNTRLHGSDWVTQRVACAMKVAIVNAVNAAWSS
jgi:lysophospholipase L1-like esterase